MGSMYGCVAIWKFAGDYASSEKPSNEEEAESSTNTKQASLTHVLSLSLSLSLSNLQVPICQNVSNISLYGHSQLLRRIKALHRRS